MKKERILFVCLGNICRSPTAEGIFRHLVEEAGLTEHFVIESAGTGDWHVGLAPDRRAQAACRKVGIDVSGHRARQVGVKDFENFDRILACDAMNEADLRALAPEGSTAEISLLMPYAGQAGETEVPDPWEYGPQAFDRTVERCQAACKGLLATIVQGR